MLFHACEVQKPILSLGCLAQDGVPVSFLTRSRRITAKTQLHKEESLFFVKSMLVAPLLTAGVSEEVAQKSQMPISPQILDDVEEPMPARPATLKDSRHSRSNRDGTAQSETLSESALVQDVRRLSRTGFTASRIVENRRQLCLNFSVTTGTWEMEAFCRLRVSMWEQTPLLEPSTRRWCQTPRRWTCPVLLRRQPNGAGPGGMNVSVYTKTKKEFFSCYWNKVTRECRPEGQELANSTTNVTDRAIRAMEPRRKPSPQCVDLPAQIWQFSKTKSRLLK